MDIFTAIGVSIFYAGLLWFYGKIRYNEGVKQGMGTGALAVGEAMLILFKKKKLIDEDLAGNIFRVNDAGMRGETIIMSTKSKPT